MDWKLLIDFLGPFVAAVIAAGGSYYLYIRREKREERQKQVDEEKSRLIAFKAYTEPLLQASVSLYERIMEIFDQRAKFLLKAAPKNEFYRYRYISTMYRLCVVLAWIRAINSELAGVRLSNQFRYQQLTKSIERFQESLYRSMFMEGERVKYLARLWKINIEGISKDKFGELENDFKHQIWETLQDADATLAKRLKPEMQKSLLNKIAKRICDETEQTIVDQNSIDRTLANAIWSISRTESWIYQDWQNAIGNTLLQSDESANVNRRFKVMAFDEFEDRVLEFEEYQKSQPAQPHVSEYRWIMRIDKLFRNLKVNSNERLDARVQQLKNIGSTLLDLIKILDKISREDVLDQEKVAHREKKLQEYEAFDLASNPPYHDTGWGK